VPAGGKKGRNAARHVRVDLCVWCLEIYLEQRPEQEGHADEIQEEPRCRCKVLRANAGSEPRSPDRVSSPSNRTPSSVLSSRAVRLTLAARSGNRRASATTSRISATLSLSIPQCSRVIAALVKRSSIVAPVGTSVLNSVMRERTSRVTTSVNSARLSPKRA